MPITAIELFDYTAFPWPNIQSVKRQFSEEKQIVESTYSTTNYLTGKTEDETIILEQSPDFYIQFPTQLLSEQYSHLKFLPRSEFTLSRQQNINQAFTFIKQSDALFDSVSELALSIHLLAADDAYDVSYSDPTLPYTIFFSVPQTVSTKNALRVGENIVHETMHLQLTLLEHFVPLIYSGCEDVHYSPWKKSMRKAQGILHAMYVFSIIHQWYLYILNSNDWSNQALQFINQRLEEIEQQIEETRDFQHSSSLTQTGKQFVRQLIQRI